MTVRDRVRRRGRPGQSSGDAWPWRKPPRRGRPRSCRHRSGTRARSANASTGFVRSRMSEDRRATESTATGTPAGTGRQDRFFGTSSIVVRSSGLIPSAFEGIDASGTLHCHGPVGEAERLQCAFVIREERSRIPSRRRHRISSQRCYARPYPDRRSRLISVPKRVFCSSIHTA